MEYIISIAGTSNVILSLQALADVQSDMIQELASNSSAAKTSTSFQTLPDDQSGS